MEEPAARRPLRSRRTRWAAALSRALLRLGLSPNQVSVLSAVFAAAAASAILLAARDVASAAWAWWIAAAAAIQLRLVCNLMDGLMAVEGGRRTPDGDLYNEFPDRIADVLVLAALGMVSDSRSGELLGWACACGALATACVRMHGAGLLGRHDFSGPMAKPQRMALATAACLAMAALDAGGSATNPLPYILGAMATGLALTLGRRLGSISHALREGEAKAPEQ
jgi:phosphatidylglycerophosphate synthase